MSTSTTVNPTPTPTPTATATATATPTATSTVALLAAVLTLAACSGGSTGGSGQQQHADPCAVVTCAAHMSCVASGDHGACVCDPGMLPSGGGCVAASLPAVGGCAVLPPDHLFNTPIDALPQHASSATWLAAVGDHPVHLDLGTQTDMTRSDYYGIPFNVVNGSLFAWPRVFYGGGWPDESDCAAADAQDTVVSWCRASAPVLPVPASPLVEGGISTTDEDHHILVVDADRCRLWELYHATPHAGGGWDLLSSATWDLASSALRPDGWTSADAAGFPILPLLLRASEAQSGTIRHALRFTLPNARIAATSTWPARHRIGSVTGASAVPMGQLFRLRSSYVIPSSYAAQSRAILQAMKTYGLYLADAGSTWFVQGEPSAAWDPAILDEVQRVRTSDLEAVDLQTFRSRTGFDPDSARVPPP